MHRFFNAEQANFLSESVSVGLRTTTIDVPFVTSPLTSEEKSWLLNHSPADLVRTVTSQNNDLLTKILKGIAVGVVSNIASDLIIDSLFSESPAQKALEEKKAEAAADSSLSKETLAEIDSVIEESMQSEKAEIDKVANELLDDLSKKAEAVAEKAKSKGLTSTKDYEKLKDTFKDKVMKDGVKAYLAEEIKANAKKNLKQSALQGQKAAKKAAKATTERLTRKELKQISKDAKAKILQNSKIKVIGLIALVDIGVDYAVKSPSTGFQQATVEIATDKATDKAVTVAQEQLIKVLVRALPEAAGTIVQRFGMKFFGGVGMFLESSSLGTGDELYDSSKPFPGVHPATISTGHLNSLSDDVLKLKF